MHRFLSKLSPKSFWFGAFALTYAVLAAYVFWGTWSPDAAPVMPDCPIWHNLSASARISSWWRGWLGSGLLTPGELRVFVGSPYFWQELQYAFALFMSALALAYFLRGRGLPRVAAYGGGLLLGFCGYWFTLFSAGHLGWFVWMTYGVFAFGLIDRLVRKGQARHALLLGATVAWASFRQPDLWLLFTVFTAAYFIFACVSARRFPSWKGLLLAALSFTLIGLPSFRGALFGALQARDEQIAQASGSALTGGAAAKDDPEKRWIFATNWSMPPEDTLEFFCARIHGDTSCPMTMQLARAAGKDTRPYTGRLGRPLGAPSGNYRQHSLYVGWMTCLLALLAVVGAFVPPRKTERAHILFFAVAALVFWIFSMGRFCEIVYRAVYALPFGDYLRAPVKWHHLTEFCLCVLAGYGLATLKGLVDSRLGLTGARLATGIVAAAALVGAIDLARNDRLFCAPIDLRPVRANNPAADEIKKRGGGLAIDLVENGNGLLAWGFGAHGAGLSSPQRAGDPALRFIWMTVEQARDPKVKGFVDAKKAKPVGYYQISRLGIRPTDGTRANAMLLEVPGVPPPVKAPPPPVDPLVVTLGVLSFVTSLGVCVYGVARA